MWRDLWIGGVLGLLWYGWRTYHYPSTGHEGQTQTEVHGLRQKLAQVETALEAAAVQRTALETQLAELNQLATDRAIELIQLQADNAELQAQVVALSQKRTRKKRVSPTKADLAPVDDFPGTPLPEAVPFALNLDAVQAKQQEAIAATQLLQTVFAEDPNRTEIPQPTEGLDAAHTAFLATLGQQTHWHRDDLQAIAQRLNVLLDGALELINETAFDRCDEALTEGEDPLTVNLNVLQELLS